MGILTLFRRNRILIFGIVATLALALSAVFAFDFRTGEILAFLWQCVLLIVAIIACAGLLFGLLLLLRRLFGQVG